MAALRSRCEHYIFILWFLLSSFFFFPRLISAVADWISTIFVLPVLQHFMEQLNAKMPTFVCQFNIRGYKEFREKLINSKVQGLQITIF